jgi:hypothetical protein
MHALKHDNEIQFNSINLKMFINVLKFLKTYSDEKNRYLGGTGFFDPSYYLIKTNTI